MVLSPYFLHEFVRRFFGFQASRHFADGVGGVCLYGDEHPVLDAKKKRARGINPQLLPEGLGNRDLPALGYNGNHGCSPVKGEKSMDYILSKYGFGFK